MKSKTLAIVPTAQTPAVVVDGKQDETGLCLTKILFFHQRHTLAKEMTILYAAAAGSWLLKLKETAGPRGFAPAIKKLGKSLTRQTAYNYITVAEWFQENKPRICQTVLQIADLDFAEVEARPKQLELWAKEVRHALPGKTLTDLYADIRAEKKNTRRDKNKKRAQMVAKGDNAGLALEHYAALVRAWNGLGKRWQHLPETELNAFMKLVATITEATHPHHKLVAVQPIADDEA